MSNFQVGQRVVCINDRFHGHKRNGFALPKQGQVYTIRRLVSRGYGVGLLLNEIQNPERQFINDYGEPGFLAHRFRPVVERKTDISIFTKMLDGSRVLETTVTKGDR